MLLFKKLIPYSRKKMLISSTLLLLGAFFCAMSATASDQWIEKDKRFLFEAVDLGYLGTESSKHALSEYNAMNVKGLAARMRKYYGTMVNEVKVLANRKGIQLPAEATPLRQQKMNSLHNFAGRDFDIQYVSEIGIACNKDMIALLQEVQTNTKDEEIRQFAQAHIPTLQEYLSMAEQIKVQVDRK